jgi:hypothetical protein
MSTMSATVGAAMTTMKTTTMMDAAPTSMVAAPRPVRMPWVVASPPVPAPETPGAANPNPPSIPIPVAWRPIVIRTRGHRNYLLWCRGRSLFQRDLVRRNRLRLS